MKIFISSLKQGGAERVASLIANEASKTQNVEIYTLLPGVFYDISSQVKITHIGRNNILKSLIPSILFLLQEARRGRVKKLQSHMFYSNYISGIIKLFHPHVNITMTHCVAWDSKFKNNKVKRLIHLLLMKLLYRKANHHIFKSQGMSKSYHKAFSPKQETIINNPLAPAFSNSTPKTLFNEDKIKILCVGRFHPSKRQKDLVAALAKISFDYEAVFLGEGALLNETIESAKQLDIPSRVRFEGEQKDVLSYYQWADIYVSCSDSEGYPNALVESMATNCIAIHSDCISGPDEILNKNAGIIQTENYINCPNGFLFPVGDINALSSALEYVANNKQNAISKTISAKHYVKTLKIEEISEKYCNVAN